MTTTDGNSYCILARVRSPSLHQQMVLVSVLTCGNRKFSKEIPILNITAFLHSFPVICDYARPYVCYISARNFAQIQFLHSRLSSFRIQYNMPVLIFRTNWRINGPIIRYIFHNYLSTYLKMLKFWYQSLKYRINFMNFQHLRIGIMKF